MKHIKQSLFITFGLAISSTAIAEMPNPWTDCGIGALIFGSVEDETASAILAALSNITWDLGSTAVTSATASPDTCNGADVSAAIYIQQNLRVVEEQIVSGSGEHLVALLDIYQCSESSHYDVLNDVRNEIKPVYLESTYSTSTASQQAESIWAVFNSNVQKSEQCKAI
ncbi:MAG: DUF3015 family protein [Myxococcota bacterium]|nr:DUF3015 family protein [Myxococcota bacterium]